MHQINIKTNLKSL